MMTWMKNEAIRQNIPTSGYYGGIILDEISRLSTQNKDHRSMALLTVMKLSNT